MPPSSASYIKPACHSVWPDLAFPAARWGSKKQKRKRKGEEWQSKTKRRKRSKVAKWGSRQEARVVVVVELGLPGSPAVWVVMVRDRLESTFLRVFNLSISSMQWQTEGSVRFCHVRGTPASSCLMRIPRDGILGPIVLISIVAFRRVKDPFVMLYNFRYLSSEEIMAPFSFVTYIIVRISPCKAPTLVFVLK